MTADCGKRVPIDAKEDVELTADCGKRELIDQEGNAPKLAPALDA